ncbi:MAG: hypothetical protein ABI480_15885 [Chitinophagaceae bacterium]
MTTIKNVCKPLLLVFFTAVLFSCNNSTDTKTADAKGDSIAPTPPPPPPAPPVAEFKPFDMMEVKHTVKDYAAWRPGFDMDSVNRKASGLETAVVGRNNDKPNNIFIALIASDVQKAKDFAASPRLKDVMTKVGVISKPDVQMFHVLRFNADSHENKWVMVTHKVKDFDSWLKVYDGEGKDKRMSEGMVDVLLGRGIEDPNLVQIVFDITDMAKAKAAISSDEKKKLMMSAGVEGKPVIEYYTTAE